MSKRRLTRRHLLTSTTFTLLGGLAGCIEVPVDESVSAPSEPTSKSSGNTPSTPTETWTEPATPNQPTEEKEEDRINDVDFVNKKKSSGGYVDFDLQVGANTWMEDVDPPEDEAGEPYFAVTINDTLVARTDIVPFRKEGSFPIPIKRAALDRFDAGTLEVRVLLFEEDSHSDDLYDTWSGTIEYAPAN